MESYVIRVRFLLEQDENIKIREELSLIDPTSTWENLKQNLDMRVMAGYKADRIQISLGFGYHEIKCKKEEDKLIKTVLEKLIFSLEQLKEHVVYQQLQKSLLQVKNPFIPIIQPFLKWISNMIWLKQLDIESIQQYQPEELQQFQELVTSKLINLERLDYDLFANSNKSFSKFQSQKQLTEMSFRFNNNFRHLDILESFINLRSLVLVFSQMSTNDEVDPSLARISQLAPQLQALTLKLIHSQPCILASAQRLKNLITLKIELTGSMKESMLDLSQLKQLSFFNLKCIDPLSFFCTQKNIKSLSNLTLINIGGYLKGQDSRDNDLETYFKSIKSHKNLEKISIVSKGYDVKSLNCLKRDIQIVSHILKQLKTIKIDCFNMKIIKEKGIDEDLVHLFIKIIDNCRDQTKISLNIPDQFISLESKLDLALALRRLKSPELFSMCEVHLLSHVKEKQNITNGIINFEKKEQILIFLGIIGTSSKLTSSIISLPVEPFLKISDTNQKEIVSKIQKILLPFQKINLSKGTTQKFPFQLIDTLSKNLTFLQSKYPLSLQDIDHLSTCFPNLITIKGVHSKQDIANYSEYEPKRNLNLILKLADFNENDLKTLFQIKGHFVCGNFNGETIATWPSAANIFELIIKNENQTLLKADNNFDLIFEQEKFIEEYSLSVQREILVLLLFQQQISCYLPLNPKMVYQDISLDV